MRIEKVPKADPGAIHIDAPGGYQYGDDHVWTPEDQARLVAYLQKLRVKLEGEN